MSEELLPCPFCGSKAKTMYVPFEDRGHIIHIFRVYCWFSRCAVIERKSFDKEAAISEAIKRWNQRVYQPEVQEAIEKQQPKKPDGGITRDGFVAGYCKSCDAVIDGDCRYCPHCGQKQDWSDYE